MAVLSNQISYFHFETFNHVTKCMCVYNLSILEQVTIIVFLAGAGPRGQRENVGQGGGNSVGEHGPEPQEFSEISF
jgi:hypothetical protein